MASIKKGLQDFHNDLSCKFPFLTTLKLPHKLPSYLNQEFEKGGFSRVA